MDPMEVGRVLEMIEKNTISPTGSRKIANLPKALHGWSEQQLQNALRTALQNAVALRGRAFEDIAGTEVEDKIILIVDWFKGKFKHSTLILQGPVGVGKTSILTACNTLLRCANASKYYVTASFIHESYLRSLAGESCMFYEFSNTPYLLLDEFGAESVQCKYYGVDHKPLESLLMRRYEKLLPTIITTNLTDKEIVERYGSRIFDRLLETSTFLRFQGKSYREL